MSYILFRSPRTSLSFLKIFRLAKIEFLRNVTNNGEKFYKRTYLKVENSYKNVLFITSLSFFGLFKSDEEVPEDKLITTIKRSVLCIQREQYDRAEQMLHLALRMAQDLQNKDGITYVYDLMANLAMEREQFKKAEKIFADVMRRLLADGLPDDNPKILHISSKLAHIAELQGELEKSRMGFMWSLTKIEECMKKNPNDVDVQELWALTRNWFGQLLMKESNFKDAKQCFQDAYDCCFKTYGSDNKEVLTILNNLSVACANMKQYDEAKSYLLKALQVAKNIKDASEEGVLLANLGLIYLREGLLKEAKSYCAQAWKIGKTNRSGDTIEQAEYCLNEIKFHTKN